MQHTGGDPASDPEKGVLRRAFMGDIALSLFASKAAIAAAVVTTVFLLSAALAPWIAPQDPFDLAAISILDARLPPAWSDGGDPRFLLGTDDQGRDVLSAILFGLRISLGVGISAVLAAAAIGVLLGLVAGYLGGWIDALIMRIADVQLTFPAILIALVIDGTATGLFGPSKQDIHAPYVLIFALALSFWVEYARTVRGSTLVEKDKDYVQAARMLSVRRIFIMLRHILPNVSGPILVIATINLAVAIIAEATLSFLGVGMPPSQPSLGTLIATGNDYLYSGEWWIAIFPGTALVVLVLNVNLLGDWLRDALNPKLR